MNDIINSIFALGACLMLMRNCCIVYQHKEVHGVSILAAAFFALYGAWNIYYFHELQQFWSLIVMVATSAVSTLYAVILFYYREVYPKRLNTIRVIEMPPYSVPIRKFEWED